jgi:hypothetical protein
MPIKRSRVESVEASDLFEDSDVCVDVNENDVRERLRELGRRPIDAVTQDIHRRRIGGAVVDCARPRRRFGVVSVAAACVVGFLVASTGLAMANALPDPAQQVAHHVLGAVQVDVPAGKEGKRGPCVAAAAKLKDKAAKQAAKDACPKGGGAPAPGTDEGQAPGNNGQTPQGNGTTNHDGDPCHGRPPWAGKMSKEERAAAKQAASREACPPDADDNSASNENTDDSAGAGDQSQAGNADTTTTTIAEQPTTTVAEDTTTTTTPVPSGEGSSTSGEPSGG